jgi:hypothetical protein
MMKTPHKALSILALCIVGMTALLATPASGHAPQRVYAAQPFLGGYTSVDSLESLLDSQVVAHPNLAEKVDFGDSWCKAHGPCTQPQPAYDGYDLLAMHITNRAIPGPKPVFWFDAGLHAEEIVPPELAMRLISWLLDGYDSNADAHWLVDYHDIWVVPMANPDGRHVAEAGNNAPFLQRKNADNDDGCSTFSPNGSSTFGVDLNRNFPFQWGTGDPALNDPCSQLYRGPSAASEEETRAIIAKIKSLIPDQRGPADSDAAPLTATGIVQSMHSFAKVNFYPWNYSSEPSPNGTDLNNIVAHMSARDAGGNGYKYCQSGMPRCLGGADGNSMDWVYGELGAASITTEIEGDGFTPPYATVDTVWQNNRQALVYMAKLARAPYFLARGPDANNLTLQPSIVNIGTLPHLTATINYAWQGNGYFQNVSSAEYYIDNPPWAGGTAAPLIPADGAFNSPTELVQASIDTAGLSIGRHIVFVRGRGIQSYEGNPGWGPISAIFLDVVPSGGTPIPTATASTMTTRTPLPLPAPLPGSASHTFPETGKTVTGIFLDYWTTHGGLPQQGYPISDLLGEISPLDGKPYTVQYFERAVFEYHPENPPPYNVLLSQLGTFHYKQKYPNGAPNQQANTSSGSILFPETEHRLGGKFLTYWQDHGGLAQQGYPISDEFTEVSDLNGQPYTVQYFERAVFEYHPENAPPFDVLLSQLGTFRFRELYNPPPR